METIAPSSIKRPSLKTLPGDDIRQIMWRFTDRFDLQMVVQSARSVARQVAAKLVSEGERNTHEWTEKKAGLLSALDTSQITSVFMEPEHGGYVEGPKNLAMALVAFELAWVDAGAATTSLAGNLALSPIHEKGTKEQKDTYMPRCVPPKPGEKRKVWRGAFALTEPVPFVGVDTGVLCGKVRVSEWEEGKEPFLQVEKRGRFITNMDFANFVTCAVESDDKRIKGSCMIILEEGDPGIFDRGAPTLKLVHQLSSTRDPILNLKVPANRIIGGYVIKDGVIVPNFSHSEVIESVFRRTRVTVGVMTTAKLLSSIEPVIRYQRRRFRGSSIVSPGTPRYELGLQQKEDVLHRLVDIWATGEASASLGFAAARLFDEFDPIEKEKERIFAKQGIKGPKAQMKIFKEAQTRALEYLESPSKPAAGQDVIVQYMIKDALASVYCPACKLWNTGYGATVMREAVSLVGGYGITEDCPGFLGQKWMDAQLEATYEGPEAVQRRQLSVTMTNEIFLKQLKGWVGELRKIASKHPGTGACTLASAINLWLWTLEYLLSSVDAYGKKLYHSQRQGVTFPLADALCWLLASRQFILDYLELEEKGPQVPTLQEGIDGYLQFYLDLCHVQAARAAGEVGKICTELVFGYSRHPCWDDPDVNETVFNGSYLDALEVVIPGISGCARAMGDVLETDGSHEEKEGPCVSFKGKEQFILLRSKLDGCLTGSRLAKDRAALALTEVMIPEAMDYPV